MAKTVLITGTSTGIGAACVQRLAGAGWQVFAGVRRSEDGEKLVANVQGDVHPLVLDVADSEQIQRAITTVDEAVGAAGLDGLVNNAGLGLGGPVELVDMADWRRQFEVNFFGPIALMQAAFPLVRRAGGRFVFMGSQAGRSSHPGAAPYGASKHALEALCESMRHELAKTPLKVALIEPGMVRTPIWEKAGGELARVDELLEGKHREDYGFLLNAMRAFIAEGKKRGVAPEKVAAAVDHALTSKRPRARYLVGPDAKIVGGVVTRLPDRARDRVLGAITQRMVRQGERL